MRNDHFPVNSFFSYQITYDITNLNKPISTLNSWYKNFSSIHYSVQVFKK